MPLVLVVDDNDAIRDLAELRLTMAGYEVITASRAKDGMNQAIAMRPDLVLMDVHMPGMTGYEAVCALRADHGYSGLISAFTASALADDAKEALEAGCDDFIPKPIGGDFEDLIAQILRKERRRRQ